MQRVILLSKMASLIRETRHIVFDLPEVPAGWRNFIHSVSLCGGRATAARVSQVPDPCQDDRLIYVEQVFDNPAGSGGTDKQAMPAMPEFCRWLTCWSFGLSFFSCQRPRLGSERHLEMSFHPGGDAGNGQLLIGFRLSGGRQDPTF